MYPVSRLRDDSTLPDTPVRRSTSSGLTMAGTRAKKGSPARIRSGNAALASPSSSWAPAFPRVRHARVRWGCQRGARPIVARSGRKTRARKRYPFLDARRRHLVLGAAADRSRRGVQETSRNQEVRRGGQKGYHEHSMIPEIARAARADMAMRSSH
jgi:hypothetical protein